MKCQGWDRNAGWCNIRLLPSAGLHGDDAGADRTARGHPGAGDRAAGWADITP